MHGKSRWWVRVGMLTLIVLIVSACSGPAAPAGQESGEKVTLNMWVFEGESEFLPVVKEEFEAKNPNIVLEITEIPEDTYVTKIDTAIAANQTPDIGFVYERRWLKANKFLALDDTFAAKEIDLEDFNPAAMSACNYEGKVYCVGTYTGAIVLAYNKDMFDAAGLPYPSATEAMTFDEYAELAAKLSKPDPDINKRVWGASNTGAPNWYIDGRAMFSEDGKTTTGIVNSPEFVHVMEVLTKLVKDGYVPSGADTQALSGANLMAEQRQAMHIIDNIVALQELEGGETKVRWGAAPTPVIEGTEPYVASWSDSYGVFSGSQHPAEAQEFISFMATEGNKLRLSQGGDPPLNNKLAEEENWAGSDEGRQSMLQVQSLARPAVFVPSFWEVTGPLGDVYTNVIESGADVQAELDAAAPVMQDELDQAWETWELSK